MLLLILSIGFLLTLILWVRLNAFLSLIITALCAGLASGMPAADLLKSIQNGIGSTLGGLVLVLALGIVLGSILAETGAAQVISERLLRVFGPRRVHWAVALTGFVVGVAMFYNAGFVVLAPLVFSVAAASGQSLVSLAISMAAPLSVTHGFLPPHPGATNVANLFGADLGKTLLLGLIVALPAVLAAGIFFPKYFLKNVVANPPKGLFVPKNLPKDSLPSFVQSLVIALLPVLLMATSTVLELNLPPESNVLRWAKFWGDPGVAMLLAVLTGLLFFSNNPWFNSNKTMKTSQLLEKSNTALGAASTLLLVIAAGGAFKQVLVDSGLGKALASQFIEASISPLLLGWGIATLLRIALGSATVAGTTAAGIVLPLVANGGVSPELMTLAVGAGSLMCSHVNDTGFWMFREWFGLSLRDTFRSWTVMETIVGLVGLAGVLLLDLLI
ncbi:MAG: gluconate permease [Phycisphaerae bacterium]|nr:gluconate permease [Saprospiraceae bacterium]